MVDVDGDVAGGGGVGVGDGAGVGCAAWATPRTHGKNVWQHTVSACALRPSQGTQVSATIMNTRAKSKANQASLKQLHFLSNAMKRMKSSNEK